MPINNDLPNKTFPMDFKWGCTATTQYMEALNAIKVKLIDCPTREQLMSYIPQYALATWEDHPVPLYSRDQRKAAIDQLFQGKLLPTAMETIGFTFLVSNIDLVDVTHLIRHRNMSFSAHCTGDRDQRWDECLVKPSIMNSRHYGRYKEIVDAAKALYAQMVDEKEISILDARTILPRSMTNHYYVKTNLRDLIPFLKQRLDRQIQPESDNIIALRMLVEVARHFPEIHHMVDLEEPDLWFVKTAQEDHSSNLYQPEKRNDIFDWKEQHFIYPRTRADMQGGQVFMKLWNDLVEEYYDITAELQQEMGI